MSRSLLLLAPFMLGAIAPGGRAAPRTAPLPDAAHAAGADTIIAFVDVAVLPMDRERVLERQTVVVRDGRIAAMGPAASTAVPAGATRIDGRGRFLMPGLVDMHAHVTPGAGEPGDGAGRQFAMYLANGVTTARSLGTPPGYLPTRERANSGAVLAPTLVIAAPSINGRNATTPEAIRARVAEAKAAGYDALKTHGMFDAAQYEALAAAAREAGLPLAGHVSGGYGLERALAAGQQVEHLDGYLPAIAADEATARALADQQIVVDAALLGKLSDARIAEVAALTKRSGTCAGPTLALFEIVVSGTTPAEMARWPEMRYVTPQALAAFTGQKQGTMELAAGEGARRFVEVRRRLVKALHDAGVPIIVSSDSPQLFLVSGFAVHREMRALAEAGIPPYGVLEAATANAARCLGMERELGTVAAGKRADLLLVDGDPRRSLAAREAIAGVMTRGRWIPRERLTAMLEGLPPR